MIGKKAFAVVILLLVVSVNCFGIRPCVKEQWEKDRRMQAEKSFDPWRVEKEDAIVVQEKEAEIQQEFSPGVGEIEETGEGQGDHETLYRIQIFASKFPQEARDLADSVALRFGKPARVDYEIPYYKVRLGDFDSLGEAEDFLRLVRRRGFPQAWVVKTTKEEREEDDRH